jgi:hypothetical protein
MKCQYNTAKSCDGLCNNCAKNIKTDVLWHKIVPATNHLNDDNDYEGAILTRTEMHNDF